jgi:hypothetical protein
MERKKEWRRAHIEECRAKSRKYYKEHAEEYREYQKRNSAYRRGYGFKKLNKPFPGSHAHHIDTQHVVYIPASIHKSIRHSVVRNRNMDKINKIAFLFLDIPPLPKEEE